MKAKHIGKLMASLLLPLAVGGIAGLFTTEAIPGWYASLNQPSFNPPDWVFGPVWTTLYIVMGISFFLIWKMEAGDHRFYSAITFKFLLEFFLFLFQNDRRCSGRHCCLMDNDCWYACSFL